MKKLILLYLLLACYFHAASQKKGIVYDKDTQKPVKNVNVRIKNSTVNVFTDSAGAFIVEDSTVNLIVIFEHPDYDNQEEVIDNKSDLIKVYLKPSTIYLENLIVTASRYKESLAEIPSSVKVLTRKEMQQEMSRTVPEAIGSSTGVWIQKTNHGGGSPIIRGLAGQQVLLMIDGIRLNNSTFRSGPNQYLNTIDPFTMDRTEVILGSGSVQYGSDAIGGVVNFLTRNPEYSAGGPHLNGRVYSRFLSRGMEATGRAEVEASTEKLAILGGITYRKFGDVYAGKGIGKQTPSGYDELDVDTKFKFKISKKNELTFAFQQAHLYDVPIYHKVKLENYQYSSFDPQFRQLVYGNWKSSYHHKWLTDTEITVSFQKTKETRKNKKNNSSIHQEENDNVETFGIGAFFRSNPLKGWIITTGTDIYYDFINSNKLIINQETGEISTRRGLYPDKSKAYNMALYNRHKFELGSNWQLTAGVRGNQIKIEVPDIDLGVSRINSRALVGDLSIIKTFNEGKVSTYASVKSAFRAPNIDDMGTLGIVDFRYEIPSKELEPEKSTTYETGIKINHSQFSGSFSFYRNNLKDFITLVRAQHNGQDSISGYQVYNKINSGEAFIHGFEGDLSYQLMDGLQVFSQAAYTFGQNASKNEPMRRIPPVFGRGGVIYQQKAVWVKSEVVFAGYQKRLSQGDIDDNRIADKGTPGWGILNINTGVDKKHLAISAGIENVFNKAYRVHGSGIDSYGRCFWITTRFSLE